MSNGKNTCYKTKEQILKECTKKHESLTDGIYQAMEEYAAQFQTPALSNHEISPYIVIGEETAHVGISIDWKKHLSDAKDIAAKKHNYDDWYQIQCLDLDGYDKDEIRANLIDDVASFFEMLVCADREWQSTCMYSDQQQWIDVKSDVLPEFDVKHLIILENGVILTGYYNGADNEGKECWFCDNNDYHYPTHWMKPTPPNSTNVSAPTFTEQQVIDLLEKMKEMCADEAQLDWYDWERCKVDKDSILSIDTKQFIRAMEM